jgi:hypothetical protein
VCSSKGRYLSITPPTSTTAGAISRAIKLTDLDKPQFPDRDGQVWWAGAPQSLPNAPDPDLTGSQVECTGTPHMQVWDGVGTVHLFGEIVIPGSQYQIQMCDDSVLGPCSDPTEVTTGKYGDVVSVFGGISQPNFADIAAIVEKFRNLSTAPAITRTDLVPLIPNHVANFADIAAAVEGFRGFSFPDTPGSCP